MKIKKFISAENQKGIKVTCTKIIDYVAVGVSRIKMNNYLLRQDYKYVKCKQTIALTRKHK